MEKRADRPRVSVLIPAFNESQTIEYIISDVRNALCKQSLSYEIIVVDDGSSDLTWKIAGLSGAKVLRIKRSVGYNLALLNGLRNANGEILVIIDSSGSYNAEEVVRLIEPIQHGKADIVSGSRFIQESDIRPNALDFRQRIGAILITFVMGALYGYNENKITDLLSKFKAIRKDVLQKLNVNSKDWEKHNLDINILITLKSVNMGFRLVEVPITFRNRIFSDYLDLYGGFKLYRTMIRGFLFG